MEGLVLGKEDEGSLQGEVRKRATCSTALPMVGLLTYIDTVGTFHVPPPHLPPPTHTLKYHV